MLKWTAQDTQLVSDSSIILDFDYSLNAESQYIANSPRTCSKTKKEDKKLTEGNNFHPHFTFRLSSTLY